MADAKELREQADAAELEAARSKRAATEADRAKRKDEAALAIEAASAELYQAEKLLDAAAKRIQRIGGLGTEWATVAKLSSSAAMLQQRLQDRLTTGRFFVYDNTRG